MPIQAYVTPRAHDVMPDWVNAVSVWAHHPFFKKMGNNQLTIITYPIVNTET